MRQLDDVALHLKGLVLVRALLETQGASNEDLSRHTDAIARVRAELARTAQTATEGISHR